MSPQILIAEDEATLWVVIAEELRTHFNVMCASNGREALALLRVTASVQLLLLDIRMPEMNGFELAEKALRLDPELKIVFMTGYADEMPPTPLLRAREIRILRKPFELAELKSLVEEMLARP